MRVWTAAANASGQFSSRSKIFVQVFLVVYREPWTFYFIANWALISDDSARLDVSMVDSHWSRKLPRCRSLTFTSLSTDFCCLVLLLFLQSLAWKKQCASLALPICIRPLLEFYQTLHLWNIKNANVQALIFNVLVEPLGPLDRISTRATVGIMDSFYNHTFWEAVRILLSKSVKFRILVILARIAQMNKV